MWRLLTIVITVLDLHLENHTFFKHGGMSNQPSTFLSQL